MSDTPSYTYAIVHVDCATPKLPGLSAFIHEDGEFEVKCDDCGEAWRLEGFPVPRLDWLDQSLGTAKDFPPPPGCKLTTGKRRANA